VAKALVTDLYELTMAASYLRRAMVGPATFSRFVRKLPRDPGFLPHRGGEIGVEIHAQGAREALPDESVKGL
jgi:nicotinic acid phosphoribosyltransferase